MSRHRVFLGTAPVDEMVSEAGNERCRLEASVYRAQLTRHAAAAGRPMPERVQLRLSPEHHDFGTYYEVVALVEEDDEEGWEWAVWLEGGGPERWDEEARAALGLGRVEEGG